MGEVVRAVINNARIIFGIFPEQINDVAISGGSNDYSIAEFSARMAVSEIAATERNP
jgi:hypothetical protein